MYFYPVQSFITQMWNNVPSNVKEITKSGTNYKVMVKGNAELYGNKCINAQPLMHMGLF